MAKIVDRLMDFLCVGDTYEDERPTGDQYHTEREPKIEEPSSLRKGNVLSLHAPKQLRVVVTEPISFDESQALAEHLKSRRQVVLNLENTDKDVAQRIIDFISGACYALDGHVQKIGDGVFLFAPHNVDITSEVKQQNSNQSPLPWLGLGREKRG
ncbi:MAG: cell division protein SepF [Bacillota bacterium]|jgi:cell division inhibitor SepF